MRNPQHLAIFARVVAAGSISAAAVQMRCGKSVVSRQLAKLEEELGARLIQRSTRRLALTEIGQMVLREAQQIERALNNIEELSEQMQQEVCGQLRVSCSVAGRAKLMPIIAEFLTLYPKVSVHLQLEDALVDLIEQKIDVAIRSAQMADSSLIARKLSDNPNILVAAPSYLARAGSPEHPQQLREHACLLYRQGTRVWNEWNFGGPGGPHRIAVSGPLQINDGSALVNAACLGSGILSIGKMLVTAEIASGQLQQILPEYPSLAGAPVYAVYPARDLLALKTSSFVNFLVEKFSSG